MVTELIDRAKKEAAYAVHAVEQTCSSSAHSVNEAVTQARSTFDPANIKDMGQRKIVEVVNEFEKHLPLLERSGFQLRSFAVDVGFPPKLIPRFSIDNVPGEEEQKAMLDQVRSNHLIHALLSALFKAASLQQHLHVGNMQVVGLEVHVSTMPAVRLLFGTNSNQIW